MSELIQTNDNRATIRWKLLTGASAMALTAYISSAALAKADDASRPTLWIELGGQMELMQGLSNSTPFTAPFLQLDPVPEVYQGVSLSDTQRPPRFAFGAEGKISFQPKDSDWIFSAGIRYGRAHSKRHIHHQTPGAKAAYLTYTHHTAPRRTYGGNIRYFNPGFAEFLDAGVQSSEHHMVLDFSAGKDVGIGLLGRGGSSNLSAGVRLLDTTENMTGNVFARPNIYFDYPAPKYALPKERFHAYTMTAHATRSFRGIGPSLSWNASAALAGNAQDGELAIDWGIDAAVLFGRQKAKTDQTTGARQFRQAGYFSSIAVYDTLYAPRIHDNPLRSRKVTVPNLGGSVGLSVKYPNFKFSVGYRYDTFLSAMDTGIDAAEKSNLTFSGPYASISIGVGG